MRDLKRIGYREALEGLTSGLRIRQRASQATDLKGNWSEKPRFGALSVQCPEKYRLWA
jgi:hypothetical protein